jgi:magnesium transporter
MDARTSQIGLVRMAGGALRTLGADELDAIDRLRTEPGTLVWLDVGDPDTAAIELLRGEFDVHPLAIEDLERRNQRPKIDTYPGQHAIVAYEVLHAAHRDDVDTDADRFLGEIHLLAGAGYLVSIHWGASPAIDEVRRRFEQRTDAVGGNVGWLLYAILDTIVDGYFPLLDGMSDEIDDLEDRIVAGNQGGETLRQVLGIKRRLLELRRILAPQRDVANALLRRDVALVDDAAIPYYQDLYDHLVRVLDQLDLYRDLVAAALDANMSVTSNTLNAVMKRLTALTVVLMVPTLIAGVYGMNFRVMPELTWPFGYFAALAVMGLAMAALALFFWRRDWF